MADVMFESHCICGSGYKEVFLDAIGLLYRVTFVNTYLLAGIIRILYMT